MNFTWPASPPSLFSFSFSPADMNVLAVTCLVVAFLPSLYLFLLLRSYKRMEGHHQLSTDVLERLVDANTANAFALREQGQRLRELERLLYMEAVEVHRHHHHHHHRYPQEGGGEGEEGRENRHHPVAPAA